MNVLEIVSRIYLSGANIFIDVDRKVTINRHELIPKELLNLAQSKYSEIEAWFLDWEGESVENKTLQKILFNFSGIKINDKVSEWMNTDIDSMYLFVDLTMIWGNNGMKSPFDDYRNFENDQSQIIKHRLYNNAMAYFKRK